MRSADYAVLIPIKRESQRVPNKNFRTFEGKSLWMHCVSKFFDTNVDVYIDTDAQQVIDEIANLDHENIFVYRRHDDLLGHNISVCKLIQHWVDRYDKILPNDLFQIHATSPYLTVDTLNKANKILQKGKYDSVASCTKHYSRFWMKNKPINHDPSILIETQKLSPVLEENSLFYAFKKSVAKKGFRIGMSPKFYATDRFESIDIDTEDDWRMCQLISSNRKRKNV